MLKKHRTILILMLIPALLVFLSACAGRSSEAGSETDRTITKVQDLTKMGDIIRSRTYEAFFPLIAITIIYFFLEGLFRRLISRIDVCLNPRERKVEKILKGIKTDD